MFWELCLKCSCFGYIIAFQLGYKVYQVGIVKSFQLKPCRTICARFDAANLEPAPILKTSSVCVCSLPHFSIAICEYLATCGNIIRDNFGWGRFHQPIHLQCGLGSPWARGNSLPTRVEKGPAPSRNRFVGGLATRLEQWYSHWGSPSRFLSKNSVGVTTGQTRIAHSLPWTEKTSKRNYIIKWKRQILRFWFLSHFRKIPYNQSFLAGFHSNRCFHYKPCILGDFRF